jgi:N-carbamoyl-L-amino-acid hydrolase
MSTQVVSPQLRINLDRLKGEILELSQIGRNEEDHGIYRMAFTDADIQARRWLMDRMEQIGLEARMDGAANVIGRWPVDGDQPAVVVGSHLDTVPSGGHLDGSLGVLIGLECARCLKEAEVVPQCPLEVIAFSDEEGRFGGMFGSQAFCGRITPETIFSSKDLNGISLADAMIQQGFEPNQALDAHRDPRTLGSFLELHIEQGPVLDSLGKEVGIVEEITGLFRWSTRLIGQANHAGTTPMAMRHDAFLRLAEFANEIPRLLEENGSDQSRATIGNVTLSPGSANTIPWRAEFSLDVRDTSPEKLTDLHTAFRRALSAIARRRSLKFEYDLVSWIDPVQCHPELVDVIARQAEALNLKSYRMPSGAAHDSQMLASITRIGMIFVPSKEGRSHSAAEWTAWQDIEAGANLTLHTLLKLVEGNR